MPGADMATAQLGRRLSTAVLRPSVHRLPAEERAGDGRIVVPQSVIFSIEIH